MNIEIIGSRQRGGCSLESILKSKEFLLAKKSKGNKDFINQLFHLYNCLKEINEDDNENVKFINFLRKDAFESLELYELAYLIVKHDRICSYEYDMTDEDILKIVNPIELLNQYRLLLLYNYKEYNQYIYELFDLLDSLDKEKEVNFWIEYLLKLDISNKDVIFNSAFKLIRDGEYEKAIEISDKISDDAVINHLKLFCMVSLKKYNEILNCIDNKID